MISEFILSDVGLHPIVLEVARSSHERIDGAGYPDGKAGDDIPLPARITLVADAFDALTSDRPYRLGRSIPDAIEELRTHAGTQFCPVVIEAMERLYAEEPAVLGLARRVSDAVTSPSPTTGTGSGQDESPQPCRKAAVTWAQAAAAGARRRGRAVARTASRSASVASTSGRRKPPTSRPSRFSAVLIGIGLTATRQSS